MSETIEFFFDFASPYAYLAHTQLPDLALRHGRSIAYRPVDLTEVKRAAGNIGPSNHYLAAKQHYIRQDTVRWAKRYGVRIVQPGNYNSQRLNRGALLAIECGVATKYCNVAGHRVWARGGAMDDEKLLSAVAADMGWDAAEFLRYTTSRAAHAAHQTMLAVARERGVFGVPTIVVGEHLWWGNDRLQFVESHLAESTGVHAITLTGTPYHG